MKPQITKKIISIGVKKLSKYAELPEYGTTQSACFDLKACLKAESTADKYVDCVRKPKVFDAENSVRDCREFLHPDEPFGFVINAGYRFLIPTGLIFDIPEGYSIRLHPRSGSALKFGITLGNAEGVVDSDYTNETYVMIQNTSKVHFYINHGDRICQGELVKNQPVKFIDIGEQEIGQKSDRVGGFGSTGQ